MKWDHALVSVRWRWRIRSFKPPARKNLRILRDEEDPTTKLFNQTTADWMDGNGFWDAAEWRNRYHKMVDCWRAVEHILPADKALPRRKKILSARTLAATHGAEEASAFSTGWNPATMVTQPGQVGYVIEAQGLPRVPSKASK